MTCEGLRSGQHDLVFHTFYGHDSGLLHRMIGAMADRLHTVADSDALRPLLDDLANKRVGIDVVRAVWVLLLNVDMRTKELVLAPQDPRRVAAAIPPLPSGDPGAEAALQRMIGMDAGKARRFFVDLHDDLVPRWLENETLVPADLVRHATDLYLNS